MRTQIYKKLLKPLFFSQDPEKVHDRMLVTGKRLGQNPVTRKLTSLLVGARKRKFKELTQEIGGVKFPNVVGLSAGFDKDAELVQILPSVGFGFTQIGSVTLEPYAGNEGPRLTRLPESEGIVVYYGLKNIGVEKIIRKLQKLDLPADFPLGFSVAKTNCERTSERQAGIDDYVGSLRVLQESGLADFYTINISCPNTFGGEPFTTPESLSALLKPIDDLGITKPIFIKMPVSIGWGEMRKLLDVICKFNVTGVVIANLVKERDPERIAASELELAHNTSGGISGKPTQQLSDELIFKTYAEYGDKLTIIGVGGVFSAEDAYRKIKNGASLVQLITSLIYEGPMVVNKVNSGLVKLLREDGFEHISQAVGSAH